MAIRKIREVPERLPAAHLYLDDLKEIEQIFLNAYTEVIRDRSLRWKELADGDLEQPHFSYKVSDKTMTDSLADLPSLGRSSTNVHIVLNPESCASVWVWSYRNSMSMSYLEEDKRWAVYGRIWQVFHSRRLVLKDALHSIPDWADLPLYAILVLIGISIPAFLGKDPRLMWAFVAGFFGLLALLFFHYFRPNKVYFARSTEKHSQRTDSARRVGRDIIFLLLGSALGEVVKKLIGKLF